MNKPEAEVIASAISIIRPAWLKTSLMTMLEKHQHRPARQVALALVAMAYDPEVKTPGLLNGDGGAPYLAVAAPLEPTYTPPALTERLCPTHLDREPCKGCAADRKAQATLLAANETTIPRNEGESMAAWARRIADLTQHEPSNEQERSDD